VAECLLLIDVQKGFISDNTEYVIPRIKTLIESRRFKHIVCTRFINYPDSPYVKYIGWRKFMADSDDTTIEQTVSDASERVFVKRTYSALTDEFLQYIRDNRIEKVYIAGIDTDCCVMMTAEDLFSHDIPFEVLTYYSASNGGTENHEAALRIMRRLVGPGNINTEPLQ